jgi:hypothetical protein
LPAPFVGPTRLYLAEGVAAVIEVKSDIRKQWKQAQDTAAKLAQLQRDFGKTFTYSTRGPPQKNVPLFVASYEGWNTITEVQSRLASDPTIGGLLVIDPGVYACRPEFGDVAAKGPLALWGLICSLDIVTRGLIATSADLTAYVR